jgi:hypothetical protein
MENNDSGTVEIVFKQPSHDNEQKMHSPVSSNPSVTTPSLASDRQINKMLQKHLNLLQDIIDFPQEQLIMRNSILTLLELPDQKCSIEKIHELLTKPEARAAVIEKLRDTTPQYWSSEWDLFLKQKKDSDPLLSLQQQRVSSRIRLINFWTSEWDSIPSQIRDHVASELKKIMMSEFGTTGF